MLHIDFETRSKVDLFKDGVYNYATDPSTEVTVMSIAFDNYKPEVWMPPVTSVHKEVSRILKQKGHIVHGEFPESVKHYIADGGIIKAHNATFERLMFWYILCHDFDIPEPKIEQFYCTATQARANNMPGALGNCARALRVKQLKDKRGKTLINTLCIPDENGVFVEDVELYVEFGEYCMQDVRAERGISEVMRPLTDVECEDYEVSETINDAGLMVDIELAGAAVKYADAEQAELIDTIQTLTHKAVLKARGKKLTTWVYERLDEDQRNHMHKYKDGEKKISMDRIARARLLNDPTVPAIVNQVVEASDFAQASSTAKFQGMINRADPEDHRVRGAYILFGASGTQRYSSRGLQVHNLPRDSLDKGIKTPIADRVKGAMLNGASPGDIEALSGHSIMQTLKRLLRYSIRAAPGHTFVCGDWGQIEARANPWLAMGISPQCDQWAQETLDRFVNQTDDYDVYCMAAEAIYGYPVRKSTHPEERQVGKVAILSLGFGGGEGAFGGMAVNYGVHVEDDEKTRIKVGWRGDNRWAQTFWKALEKAAIKAVRNPLTEQKAGRITYLYQPGINHGSLWALLPSGNVLCYPHALVKTVDGKYGPQVQLSAMKANWTPKQGETEWPRIALWGGILCENVCQAVCAVLLRELLADLILERHAPVAGHTHDEALLEVEIEKVAFWESELGDAMTTPPSWAEGLPLDADIWTAPRYRK